MRRRYILFPVAFNLALDWFSHDPPHWCLYLLRSVVSLEPRLPKYRVIGSDYLNLLLFFLWRFLLSLIDCRVIVGLHTGTQDYLLLADCDRIVNQCVIGLLFMHIAVDHIDLLVEPGERTQTVVFVAQDVCELVQGWVRIGLPTCQSHTGCNQS